MIHFIEEGYPFHKGLNITQTNNYTRLVWSTSSKHYYFRVRYRPFKVITLVLNNGV